MRKSTNACLVTTTTREGMTRTQVWDRSQPLLIGQGNENSPFRWILENSATGVRIRDLTIPRGRIQKTQIHEFASDALDSGVSVELPKLTFRIRNARSAAPAFQGAQGDSVAVFQCVGPWVQESFLLEEAFTARVHGKSLFTLKKSGAAEFRLDVKGPSLRITSAAGATQTLQKGGSLALTRNDLVSSTLDFEGRLWRFGQVAVPSFTDAERPDAIDADAIWFKKSLRSAAIGLTTFVALSWLWPAPKKETQELIPAQFTKIIMAQQKKPASAAPSGATAANETAKAANVPAKVQNAAVVQAFRAKALNNAVNGLLKGGMAKLLNQSDFVMGSKNAAEAKRLLDTTSTSLKPTAVENGLMNAKNVQVVALGGEGGGGAGGVGYGKGVRAGVNGQGKGFVPFVAEDAAGSRVDEGLTKDEVGEVIHKHLSEVRYCYEAAMLRTPDIEGKLVTKFTIGGNGAVKVADISSSTLPDPRLDDCIIRRLLTWKFPNPRGGVDVAVSYPFVFKTLGR